MAVTMTAGLETIFHHESDPKRPRLGFLQKAAELDQKLPSLTEAAASAEANGNMEALSAAKRNLHNNRMLYFNNRVDVIVVAIFLLLVSVIFLISLREWILLLARRRLAVLQETPPVWLPDYAVAEGQPIRIFGVLALALALAKELSGESHLERARQMANCGCMLPGHEHGVVRRGTEQELYVETVERRFNGINRCC
jgi:carbon starvation protein